MKYVLPLMVLVACKVPDLDTSGAPLVIEHLRLPGPSIGTATLVVGPEKTVLIDAGNDAHADRVVEAVERYGELDWLILTHYHADHIGGVEGVVARLDLNEQLVSRGMEDISRANESELDDVRDVSVSFLDLCDPTGCGTFTADLGGGATLSVLAVNATVGNEVMDVDDENARSTVIRIQYGDFTYVHAGDLTGGEKNTDDAESFVVEHLPDQPVADVLHLNHHGKKSSTNQNWVDFWLPDDGARHDAVVSANRSYLSAPDKTVLQRVGPRVDNVWVTAPGYFADVSPQREVGWGAVVVEVDSEGYSVCTPKSTGCPVIPEDGG